MNLVSTCQVCHRPTTERSLLYRKGQQEVRHEALLQCDVCERFACADCLEVYDIFSGYDFLCQECARQFAGALGPARS